MSQHDDSLHSLIFICLRDTIAVKPQMKDVNWNQIFLIMVEQLGLQANFHSTPSE